MGLEESSRDREGVGGTDIRKLNDFSQFLSLELE